MRAPLVAAVLILAMCLACGGHDDDDKNNELMAPGQDCLGCHVAGGSAGEAPFSAAGTVFASSTADPGAGLPGVTVVITDANSVDTTLVTNAAGNFFTRAPLALPLKKAYVVLNGTRRDMAGVPEGACNRCHTRPPVGGTSGRIYLN